MTGKRLAFWLDTVRQQRFTQGALDPGRQRIIPLFARLLFQLGAKRRRQPNLILVGFGFFCGHDDDG